ncbi:AfsR/SARP family transcriptional regulator [Streptomyces sp. 6N223]|uniref:AfsR/SARP family transcriptional regulator n=1 Tax=Streptomyces sp. 6N223 TaxID=3457412 RepID=UPI003FD517B3
MAAQVRLLGPVEVRGEGGLPATLGPPQQRCVLASLALEPGRPVAAETLIDRLWREAPPENARQVLYTYVSRLRRRLREADAPGVARRDGGYVLRVAPEAVDVHRSRALARRAREEPDPARAVGLLREAAALWRGTPLAGLRGEWAEGVRTALTQESVTLLTQRFEAELASGRHGAVLSELASAAAAHPLAEPLAGLLMLALYRAGRQADALAAYARARHDLVTELGEDPGPVLSRLHAQILRRDPALGAPGAFAAADAGAARPGPGASPETTPLTAPPPDTPGTRDPNAAPPAAPPPATATTPPGTPGAPDANASAAAPPPPGATPGTSPGSGAGMAPGTGPGTGPPPGAPPGAAAGPGPDGVAVRRPVVRPAQLPADVRGFTGREASLRRLDAGLDAGGGALVTTIVGTAGVGKTALAVHWAHRVAHRFPDGQLYVNLRGFDESGTVVAPDQALRDVLAAFGVPAEQLPSGTDALAGMFRSVLAGRRVLMVLDNARDAAQVRPLLPGAPGCLALVTSRNQLPGLVAATGATQHALDLFTRHEARQMLASRLGPARLAGREAEDAVAEILERCARLPLALAIVAARVAARPDFPLATIVAQLREAGGGGLGNLALGEEADVATDIRAVFSWSYRTLGPEAARLFRLLGLHPGPDLAVGAAASLAGLSTGRARPLLAALVSRNLLTEYAPGRFTLHDLLRHYACELARDQDPEEGRHAAFSRLLDYCVHSAHAANAALGIRRVSLGDAGPSRPATTPERFDGTADALEWFAAEHPALIAAVEFAARTGGFDDQAIRLGRMVSAFLLQQCHWHEHVELQHTLMPAAQRLDDTAELGRLFLELGLAHTNLRLFRRAREYLDRALGLFRERDDVRGQAGVYTALCRLSSSQRDYAEAMRCAQRSLELHRALGAESGAGRMLSNIAWYHVKLGAPEQALVSGGEALAILEKTGDRYGAAYAWGALGDAHAALGEHAEAIACLRRSLDGLHTPEPLDPPTVADTLTSLGDIHQSVGDEAAAHDAWRRALPIYEELARPEAEEIRARLGEGVEGR